MARSQKFALQPVYRIGPVHLAAFVVAVVVQAGLFGPAYAF